MKKYSVMFATMLVAVSLAAFAGEPQGNADQQTLKAPVQMSDAEMDQVVAGKVFQVCLDPFGCTYINVPDQVLHFLHHQLQPPQHHDHHRHH